MKRAIYILLSLFIIIVGFSWNISAKNSWEDFSCENMSYFLDLSNQDTSKVQSYLKPGSPEYIDSMKTARARYVDSMKAARQKQLDSMKAERQRMTDSMTAERQRLNDSMKTAMEAEKAARQHILDSTKLEQQRRLDSMATIRAYRNSQHYKDSVALERKRVQDSIVAVRKAYNDSLRAVQKAQLDSAMAVRQKENDSLKAAMAAQRAIMERSRDSMKVVRQAITDSLAKMREAREKEREIKTKEKEKKQKLALELKVKKKQDAYSNEQFLKKKWSFPRSGLQNLYTHFNYYYNAKEKMRLAEQNMVKNKLDNYDATLPLFVFDAAVDTGLYKSDMDSIIQTLSVGIQIHDPRSKWQDDLYFLVGKAYYYKGDYANAIAAFKYVVNSAEIAKKEAEKKKKAKGKGNTTRKNSRAFELNLVDEPVAGLKGKLTHQSATTEAILWLSRTFVATNQIDLAQTVLNMVRSSKYYEPKILDGRVAVEQAYIDLRTNDIANAMKSLALLNNDKKNDKWLRERGAYINGQLFQSASLLDSSNNYFVNVIDYHPKLDMEFYARKNIYTNKIQSGDVTNLEDELDNLLKEDKFNTYFDQLHYAKAQIALTTGDTVKALAALDNSVKKAQQNPKQKSLSMAMLGNIYYDQNKYTLAKNAYDSTLLFANGIAIDNKATIKTRANSLNKIIPYADFVTQTDSLLALAKLSDKEQRDNARTYIKALEKHIKDSIALASVAPAANNMNMTITTPGTSSWYFSNSASVQKGKNTFQQKWGNRTLKDNWNRSLQNSFASNSSDDDTATMETNDYNLPSVDSLVALIPNTEVAQIKLKNELATSLFELGKGYVMDLNDLENGKKTLLRLEKEYPNHSNQAESLYLLYYIASRQNDSTTAETYKKELISKYPTSTFAQQLSGSNIGNENNSNATFNAKEILSHYDETQALLNERKYDEVIERIEVAQKKYPNFGAYQKQYKILSAMAYAGKQQYPQAEQILTEFLAVNPNDSLTQWAQFVQAFITKQKAEQANASQNSNIGQVIGTAEDYKYNPNALHYVILYTQNEDSRFNALKSGIVDYNNIQSPIKGLRTSIAPISNSNNLIVIKEFKNASEAKKYITQLFKIDILFKAFNNKQEIQSLIISNDNIIKLFTDRDWNAYKTFYQSHYK